MRGHFTTNAAEGSFGNLKFWTNHELLPMKEILSMFINESEIMMKNHIKEKFDQLSTDVYNGRKLGQYAINKIQKRIEKCKKLIIELLHENVDVSQNACQKLENCNCLNDLPCVHMIYKKLLTNDKNEVLIKEDEIADIYFLRNFEKATPSFNSKIIVERNKEENWSYNFIMNKMKFLADAAQRSDAARQLIKNFFMEAEKLKQTIDPLAKDVLLIPGAQPTVPAATVEKYKKKKKGVKHCSYCKSEKHNAATCVLKKMHDNKN